MSLGLINWVLRTTL